MSERGPGGQRRDQRLCVRGVQRAEAVAEAVDLDLDQRLQPEEPARAGAGEGDLQPGAPGALGQGRDDGLGAAPKPTWYDVERNLRLGAVDEAVRIGEELIQSAPLYPDGHGRLGSAYLAAGNVAKARAHYAEAARLFPSGENIDLLNAADARIKQENPRP